MAQANTAEQERLRAKFFEVRSKWQAFKDEIASDEKAANDQMQRAQVELTKWEEMRAAIQKREREAGLREMMLEMARISRAMGGRGLKAEPAK